MNYSKSIRRNSLWGQDKIMKVTITRLPPYRPCQAETTVLATASRQPSLLLGYVTATFDRLLTWSADNLVGKNAVHRPDLLDRLTEVACLSRTVYCFNSGSSVWCTRDDGSRTEGRCSLQVLQCKTTNQRRSEKEATGQQACRESLPQSGQDEMICV